jgi:hypothetical protein
MSPFGIRVLFLISFIPIAPKPPLSRDITPAEELAPLQQLQKENEEINLKWKGQQPLFHDS